MANRRPATHGRSILADGDKLHVRGVTYGTFQPNEEVPFPPRDGVRRDLEAMAAAGVNSLRTYVPPPLWLLDDAAACGLHVLVGLAWEQHVAFLDDPELARSIVARVGAQVRECEAHPALLGYALGNEIPAPIVRWHGKPKIERFLERLCWEGKAEDPNGLFTYVNYPSTEYLELPFLDLAAFNVFLEDERTYESYLARLQNLAGDRPLLITEVGIDSRRNGEEAQARALDWQVRHAFGTGAAGVFVFSWTDEWHRGGHEVTDWDFGMVDRARRPKPALDSISAAFEAAPFAADGPWPPVSVIVCTHNGARTLPECLEGVSRLSYPDFELIVVDDGSGDDSAEIARAHGAEVIEIEHGGLSVARNAGIRRSRGEIVAFLDDDAYPDPDWLHYLAAVLRGEGHAGVGGPNIPPEDGMVADCVAAAPGGPIHVLVSDREAEHVPGCNMAFRKSALEQIGCFDDRFRVAGDDVDVCWRLQEAGWTLGFSAGAVVMHRRRDSVRRYLRQQYGYGKAEALLERKWPSRYNRVGSSRWSGRIYDAPGSGTHGRRAMVRYGTWGGGLFQSIYEPAPGALANLLRAPETLMLIAALAALSALGLVWQPLLLALPLFLAGAAAVSWRALAGGWRANPGVPGRPARETLERRVVTALLFGLQPLARLAGRLRNGLSPWRRRRRPGATLPHPRVVTIWSESWRDPQQRIQELHDALAGSGGFVRSGGPFDRWDLDLRAAPLGGVKIRAAVEEHGDGRQLVRVKIWPRASAVGSILAGALVLLSLYAWGTNQIGFAVAMTVATGAVAVVGIEGTVTAMSLALGVLRGIEEDEAEATLIRGRNDEPPEAPGPSPAAPELSLPPARERDAILSPLRAHPEQGPR
jgi:GT2 family glycosyltransferase